MALDPKRDWMWLPDFDDEAMAEFERRLARARPHNHAKYLWNKGSILTGVGDPKARSIAIELLERVDDVEHNYVDTPLCHKVLARTHREDRNLEKAAHHLRRALETSNELRSGLGNPELELAEIYLEMGDYSEAEEQLVTLQQRGPMMGLRSNRYRFARAAALVQEQLDGDPELWADRALELAAITEPQVPEHPTLGIVDASPGELSEMQRLADSSG